jgi:hypothetical protein
MNSDNNRLIEERLLEAASLLEQQNANPFRVLAYRRAADALRTLPGDIDLIFRSQGFEGLTGLPGIGPQIAGAIAEMLRFGRWTLLDRLRGGLDPEALFASIPGIGPKLARTVMESLHVDTLEALELAAHDGRLEAVPGFGPRRIAMVRAELAQMLGRIRTQPPPKREEPGVDVLLDVDREYREKAKAGKLRLIAPRRFNPKNEAWLPILHTERGAWHFTVLFSNTHLAHSLHRTDDWVIIYFNRDHAAEGQRTVVTETRGPLEGRRVVRGRERECGAHYRAPVQLPLNVA